MLGQELSRKSNQNIIYPIASCILSPSWQAEANDSPAFAQDIRRSEVPDFVILKGVRKNETIFVRKAWSPLTLVSDWKEGLEATFLTHQN